MFALTPRPPLWLQHLATQLLAHVVVSSKLCMLSSPTFVYHENKYFSVKNVKVIPFSTEVQTPVRVWELWGLLGGVYFVFIFCNQDGLLFHVLAGGNSVDTSGTEAFRQRLLALL